MKPASSAFSAALLLLLSVVSGCSGPQHSLDDPAAEPAPATLETNATPLAPPGNALYVGPDECHICHAEQYESWRKTAHSRSYEVLAQERKQYVPECLRCHTTGFGEASGFVDAERTPRLAAVTCEACHGPGSRHVEAQKNGQENDAEYGAVNCPDCQHARICILCHRPPRSELKSAINSHFHHPS